jgi:glycosyltransferase involved in cell wall biosynthesis
MPEISVVIPTRNRAALLGRCLASLCGQTLDASRFEICVVNNGAREMVEKIVGLVNTHYPKHRIFIIDQPVLGVAAARNAGTGHTTSPLIAQGDDDATMPPDWLERFLGAFATQDIAVGKVAGEILPVWGAPRPDWVADGMLPLLAAASGLGTQSGFVAEALPEGNACYRREALDAAGHFPDRLGRKGNNLLSGERAVDLAMRDMGWKLYYDPTIVIHHAISADRLQPVWMRRRAFWQGVSDFAENVYLQSRNIETAKAPGEELPLDRKDWAFINDTAEPPDEAGLARLRGLGFVLARAGFMPV